MRFTGRSDYEVPQTSETEDVEVKTEESSVSNKSKEKEADELIDNNQPAIKIGNHETEVTEVNENMFSSEIIFNSTTTQETVEFLSNELFSFVENINNFGTRQVKEAENLIAQIVDFCNAQPIEEQWNNLASITRRNSKALLFLIGNSGKEYKDWLLNLPQLLANAVLDNPEELDWVDKRLRSEALLLIANSTAFS